MPRSRRPDDEGRLLQAVLYAYIAASAIARWLPERLVYKVARVVGTAAARRSKKRQQVARNIGRIVGEDPGAPRVQTLVDEAFRSYARYWLETFRLVRASREFFLERFKCEGEHFLSATIERSGAAIVAVGHLGNWDAAGAWVGATGRRLVTVAEVLRPRRMFEFFVEHRAQLGMTIHPAEPGVTQRLIEEVRSGAVLAILADRDLKGTGPEVTFFGEPATFPAGTAKISIETQVPILVAGIYGVERADGTMGWEAEIAPPIAPPEESSAAAIAALTQEVATVLEGFVARRPEEWHVFQPFWKADRTGAG